MTRDRRFLGFNRRLALVAGGALAVGAAVVAVAPPGEAVNTRTIVLDSMSDLSAGVLDRVQVTSDGQVVAGAEITRVTLDPAAASVWSILDLGDGAALLGSGVDGRIYRVENNRATLYAETGAVAVTALARGEDGTVYAATIPDGRIFRVRPPQNGHTQTPEQLVQLPDTDYVWSIAWDRGRHALLAATGPHGQLFAVDTGGHATVVFDSDEPHLYSLALGANGKIYTGAGGGHAILYEVRGPGDASALGRFPGDEVKSIAVAGNELYVAANEFAEPPEPIRRNLTQTRLPSPGGSIVPRPHPGHGRVFRVRANGASERVYDNADAHVTALEFDAGHNNDVYAALGAGGRVMAIASDRTNRVAFDVDETQVLALDLTGRARLFGTGDSGGAYAVGAARPAGATWTSKVLDGTTVARWGAVRWRGTGSIDWEARSGNSDPPDATWSAWTALNADGVISSPPARYVQIRARWARDPASVVRGVTVYYLPVNQRAVLTDVTAEAKTGDPRPQAVKVSWKVDNPDNDALRYRLRFRGDAEQNWRQMLRQGEYLTGLTYDWSVEGLPEGWYRVQVEASDEAANPEDETERDTRASEPVLVDNTPPRVTAAVENGRVRGEVVDGVSAVTRVELSVDTQDWRPVRAADGVLDERTEQYEGVLPALSDGGEHVVAVRAYDEAGNVGSASATFRVAGAANAANAGAAPNAGRAPNAGGPGRRR